MRTPMIEKIVQTAKQTVKAVVERARARVGLGVPAEEVFVILRSIAGRGSRAVLKQKSRRPGLRTSRDGSAVHLSGSFA
jgi:hypothetical protein